MKTISATYSPPHAHWVGDGFPVRSLFSYDRMGPEHISPFLMLDYAGPRDFAPTGKPRGVGQHPHRGFETVTIVYDGEVAHRDSSGGGGVIGKGDVQWMTAGKGIIHEEFHSPEFSQKGGRLEMVQLWVNLRAADKLVEPRYQSIKAADIARVELADNAGEVNVIAGSYQAHKGPAQTFSPINVWDVRLHRDKSVTLNVPEGHTTMLVVLNGTVQVNESKTVRDAELVCFERSGSDIRLEANTDTKLLLLTGEPIDEPVVGHGPFVMNSAEEIRDSIAGFQSGRFGKVSFQ